MSADSVPPNGVAAELEKAAAAPKNSDTEIPALREVNVNAALGKETEPVKLGEGDRLLFAKQVLLFLAIICIGAIIAYARDPDNTALKEVFELIKIGAFPIVTLVVTFYFPNSSGK